MKSIYLSLGGVVTGPGADGGETLRAARTPHLDELAAKGQVGGAHLLPEDAGEPEPGAVESAVRLSLLGCDPRKYQVTAGPLEASAREVPLEPRDQAFSCWLVGTDGETFLSADPGGLSDADGRALLERAQERLGTRQLALFPGAGNRHTLRWADGGADVRTRHPETVVGKPLSASFPEGDGAERLISLMWDSLDLLDNHPVNRRRRDAGVGPANLLWPFAPGRLPDLPNFLRAHRRTGAVLSGDELLAGAARLMGLRTAPAGTDPSELAPRILQARDAGADVILAAMPEERAGPGGDPNDPERTAWRAEQFDRLVVGPLLEGLKQREAPFRILVLALPPKPRPGELALFLMYDSLRERDGALPFDGRALEDERLQADEAWRLMARLTA